MSNRSWRARVRASDSRLLWLAVALCGRVLAAVTRRGRWDVRAGHALERLGLGRAAARAYRRATARAAGDPGSLLRLGELSERCDDPPAALAAYARAGSVAAGEQAREARRRRVALHDRLGQWTAAGRLLEEQLRADPTDAAGHRHLARIARRTWECNGSFAQQSARPGDAVFAPLSPATADLADEESRATLAIARRALERAVELEPSRWAWRGALGELCEAAGDLDGAIACYELVVEREQGSDRRAAFKGLHQWQFALERAHHRAGEPRVHDPLFGCAVGPAPDELQTPPPDPPGFVTGDWIFGGLALRGFVVSRVARTAEVVVDDLVLRRVNLEHDAHFPRLGILLDRTTLEQLPPDARLRVRAPDGRSLLAHGRSRSLRVSVPHGTGRIRGLLAQGVQLEKKGALAPSPERARRRQDRHLELYARARDAFDRELDTPLLLIHGTLLGQHRDGDLIPGDDDFDVAYVSDETTPRAVKEEAKRYIVALIRAGFTVSFNRSGRLFRVHLDDFGDHRLHLDVHPIWLQAGRAWLHNDVCFPAARDDFLPAAEAELRSTTVRVPARPEVFLRARYGPGWTVPDPGFMDNPGDRDPAVRRQLSKALMTPAEYRELDAELARERAHRTGMGRLVSIGSQPLYPLDDFVP